MAGDKVVSIFSFHKYNPMQTNLGNTVLVNTGQLRGESDLWCLGYLQDTAGDEVLIDLDCAQFPKFWISTQYVWYHYLIDFGIYDRYPLRPPPLHVQVAVRNELDGPLVFRPTRLLNRPSRENLYMCCVIGKTTEAGIDDNQSQQLEVVHHWQVVQSLPTTEPSLFGRLKKTGRLDEIPILKQTVHTISISADHKPFPDYMLKCLVYSAVGRAGFQRSFSNGLDHRAFVDIRNKSIMFLLFDLHLWEVDHEEEGQLEWTIVSEQKFAAKIAEFLKIYGKEAVPDVRMCGSPTGGHTTHAIQPLLGTLPRHLLFEVLVYLDFHSQLRAKRVCSIWHSLLRTPSASVVIDFGNISRGMYLTDASGGYHIGTLLDRAVSRKARALALENVYDDNHYRLEQSGPIMKILQNLLALKEANLLAIMLRNCKLDHETRMSRHADDFMVHELHHISKLLPVCQRLFLANFTTKDFPVCDCSTMYRWCKIPRVITITLPYLEFRRSAGERDSVMKFIQALEPHLPSVDAIRAQFKERHQYLVHTLEYPDGWQRFRQFLRRHTFTELSALDSFWNELDLRNFDQLPLTKMVLLLLDVCLDMAFEDDDLMVYNI